VSAIGPAQKIIIDADGQREGRVVEKYRVDIVGAAGLVGQEILRILEQRDFPIENIRLFASGISPGMTVSGLRYSYEVHPLEHTGERNLFLETDFVFFAEGDDTSRHWVQSAARAGATVIDGSSVYRKEPEVPLVIPEINAADIKKHRGIIASPGCSTILMNVALFPLHKINPIKRLVVSTYQSVSGMGQAAMDELTTQSQQMLSGENTRPNIFPHEIGFNVLPQVDVFLDNGYTKEEWQLLEETRKILHNEDILVSATCVRVPVFKGHCQAITAEFTNEINSDVAGDILAKAPGVRVVDDTDINLYPHPRRAAGTDQVMVGRIRQDALNLNGLVLWVAADNIRKGAALNMVQIAEEIFQKGWLKVRERT
jgi:aspartate-semialdehyde dehydrogenase